MALMRRRVRDAKVSGSLEACIRLLPGVESAFTEQEKALLIRSNRQHGGSAR